MDYYNTLNELYTAQQIKDIVLKRNWDKISACDCEYSENLWPEAHKYSKSHLLRYDIPGIILKNNDQKPMNFQWRMRWRLSVKSIWQI